MKTRPLFLKPLLAAWLCVPLLAPAVHAQDPTSGEHARLALIVRQLDSLDKQIDETARLPTSGRYHFDYTRLKSDISRIRTGIQDYLQPQRAQPRDPVELTGHYQRNNARSEP